LFVIPLKGNNLPIAQGYGKINRYAERRLLVSDTSRAFLFSISVILRIKFSISLNAKIFILFLPETVFGQECI